MSAQWNNLPPSLLREGRFCCWKYEDRNGRRTKVPYNPRTGGKAQSTNLDTFAPLDAALKALERDRYDGIGVGIFGEIGAIDIDHCIDDNGELSPTAFDVMDTMQAYTEHSPSGHGLRILFKATGFQYDKARYYINNQMLGMAEPSLRRGFASGKTLVRRISAAGQMAVLVVSSHVSAL